MYFENFSEKNYIIKSLHKNGLSVIKKILDKETVLTIKKKASRYLNQPRLLKTISDIKAAKNYKISSKPHWLPKKFWNKNDIFEFKQPTGLINKKLSKNIIKKGYKYYSNFTNSVEFKDPLINFPEISKIVFNENVVQIAKNFLKANPYLGYVALRCHFNNNLPTNDFNLFHTDDRIKTTNPKNRTLKILAPFHSVHKGQIEFRQIILNKKKFGSKEFYKLQYSKFSELPRKLKKLLIRPKVFSGDAYFFDPDNFFHNADKPKKLRIMLYITFVKKENYMIYKTKKIRIKKSLFNKLSNKQRSFGRYLNLI